MSRDDWDGIKNDNAEHRNSNNQIAEDTPIDLRVRALETRLQILMDKETRRQAELENTTQWLIRTRPQFDWRPIIIAMASTSGMLGFFYYYLFVHKGLH